MKCLILLFLLWPAIAFPQPLDSLLMKIDTVRNDSAKAVLLCNAAMKLYYSDPDSSRYFTRKALSIGEDIVNNTIIAKSYNILGIICDVTNKWDSALYYYNQSLEYAMTDKNKGIEASVLNNIGLIYWNKGEYDHAIEFYNRSLLLFEELQNQRGIANTLNNIGLILWEQDRLQDAISYHRLALQKRLEMDDQYGIGASYSNIARIYDEMGSTDSAFYFAYKAIRNKTRIDDNYGLAITYNNLAGMYLDQDIRDSAYFYFIKSIEEYKMLGNLSRCAGSLYNLADFYMKEGDDKSAEASLQEALSYAKEADAKNILYKIYGNLGMLYHQRSDNAKAYKYLKRRVEVHDSLYTMERDEMIADIQAKYETERKDKEIAILGQKKAEAELKVSNRNRMITGLGFGSVALIFLGLFIVQRNRRKAQAEKDQAIILEKEKGLEAVFAAQEDERKRIAKELHDGIVQQLAGVILGMRRLAGLKAEKYPDERLLLDSLEAASGELREVSHRMMPKAISELGAVAAIEDMLQKTLSHLDIHYEFEHFGINGRLPEKTELALFRISQELVNNLIKHSKAKNVNIQLFQTGRNVVFTQEDDGIGFPENIEKKGIGLMNIRSRVETLKGSVIFENNSGDGATVTVTIPLDKND